MREEFRRRLEAALSKRPVKTPSGEVASGLAHVRLGCPGGEHRVDRLWVYRRNASGLEMVFGFYANFTPDDLICKVVSAGEYPVSGEGASVQFNADRTMKTEGGAVLLIHEGKVTVRIAIKREVLEAAIEAVCPKEARLAHLCGFWPVRIGTTANIPGLLDQLFVYAYCIEQGKRRIRREAPLLRLIK